MIFKSDYKITQIFGNEFIYQGKPYYARYGLRGHNGIDVVPIGNELEIYSLLGGQVLKKQFNITYGNLVAIWNRNDKLCTYYCHLEGFGNYESGDYVPKGALIGIMGNTGFSLGAHLHLGLVETDSNGYRINRDNGYNGWVSPERLL